jgi:hypothetical protein
MTKPSQAYNNLSNSTRSPAHNSKVTMSTHSKDQMTHKSSSLDDNPQVLMELSHEERQGVVRELPALAVGNALELITSRAGCFSCGHTFMGWGTLYKVDQHNSARCPSCELPALVTLSALNELLSEESDEALYLSAPLFHSLIREGANVHFLRSPAQLERLASRRAEHIRKGLPLSGLKRWLEEDDEVA